MKNDASQRLESALLGQFGALFCSDSFLLLLLFQLDLCQAGLPACRCTIGTTRSHGRGGRKGDGQGGSKGNNRFHNQTPDNKKGKTETICGSLLGQLD
ncbi:hypothetical protein [Pseudomonas sp. BN515]|uniref:hypothetical protein n=1 Tax=Pseudomonas sp. BN515 TaxID=2567892 RepID=UPI00245697A2|nr:hypothetical protein [Pseudomonas sp. BN515]